jgi:hypothetical protein
MSSTSSCFAARLDGIVVLFVDMAFADWHLKIWHSHLVIIFTCCIRYPTSTRPPSPFPSSGEEFPQIYLSLRPANVAH